MYIVVLIMHIVIIVIAIVFIIAIIDLSLLSHSPTLRRSHCTQIMYVSIPLQTEKYGLSFVKLHSPAEPSSEESTDITVVSSPH